MKNVVIFGASSGGKIVADALLRQPERYRLKYFLDNDTSRWGQQLLGISIAGGMDELAVLAKAEPIDKVIVAISNIGEDDLAVISETCRQWDIELRIIPQALDIVFEDPILNQMREVSVADLLGRHEVSLADDRVSAEIQGQTVLVTGAAGSIGSEVVRQVAKFAPARIIGLDVNENDLYLLELFVGRHFPEIAFSSVICSIQDRTELVRELTGQGIDVVFHCAAHKHVPLMERSPVQAVKNNVLGTLNVAQVADELAIGRFVLISTDKAVNPTNVMGASKRVAELIVLEMNRRSDTRFMAVRFGNVLGSAGSVIPIFKELLKEGRDLTITDERMTRYFMTIPEAARLVIESGVQGQGGELFVLEMGEPVEILTLARKMIELSRAQSDIKIIGLRPGEKLYEELFYDMDSVIPTDNRKILLSTAEADQQLDLTQLRQEIEAVIADASGSRSFLGRYVASFSGAQA
ncbi:polysaccharide biosynthesis protein [Ferrimonas kyonanensis]|uniref:polysaccharide biosynthesis protein n=1 Tax=Ferrimonas kyonanensis TaxID=364763 RepID=UPI0003FF698B|nr:nucleoside-diphosphate sugar epimerase/dehydratase [Ferrimonas kyonanensis]